MSPAGDQPRFLARGLGYVSSSAVAMDGLEAVGAAEQKRQTQLAHRQWRLQQQRDWGRARTVILASVESFKRSAAPDRKVARDLQAIERITGAVDRRLGL